VTTRGVILAAGRGSRLGELTRDVPKPLLSVAGRPVIVHVLDGMLAAGIRDLAIVIGYRGDQIEEELGNGAAVGASIEYFRQEHLDGSARAVALARDFVGDAPFAFTWADILVRPENMARVVRASSLTGAAIAVNRVDDPATGAAVYVDNPDGDGYVERIVEKPAPGSSTTPWNNAGLGVLPPAIWPLIEALTPSPRGEYELPNAIAALVESGAPVRAVPIDGPWFDIGTLESLAAARATLEATP
jgi:dTDP-glucose pyrophosphorylase